MSIKTEAINEMERLMKDFDISPSRLGRDLFNNPNFYWQIKKHLIFQLQLFCFYL